MSFIKQMLMRIAFQVLQNVLGQLTQQLNVVQDAVLAPIKSIGQLVGGGSIWRGDGATKFTEVVSTQFVPGIGLSGALISFTTKSLTQGQEIMRKADQVGKGKATGLGDLFGGIANF